MTTRHLALASILLVGTVFCGPSAGLDEVAPVDGATCGHRPPSNVATDPGRLLAAADGIPVGSTPCPGVRPGAAVWTTKTTGQDSGCTFNFAFTSREVEGRSVSYIGSAGHCPLAGMPGIRTWDPGSGPQAYALTEDSTRMLIGHYVYAVHTYTRDFALIRLLDEVEPEADVCHWGGPVGIYDGPAGSLTEPVVLRHYGQGFAVSPVVPARTGLAHDLSDPDIVFMTGVATPGDSGGPVIGSDGGALGVIVSIGGQGSGNSDRTTDPGTVRIMRLAAQLELAEAELGVSLDLITAPLR